MERIKASMEDVDAAAGARNLNLAKLALRP
jgi:hypothetical protein